MELTLGAARLAQLIHHYHHYTRLQLTLTTTIKYNHPHYYDYNYNYYKNLLEHEHTRRMLSFLLPSSRRTALIVY